MSAFFGNIPKKRKWDRWNLLHPLMDLLTFPFLFLWDVSEICAHIHIPKLIPFSVFLSYQIYIFKKKNKIQNQKMK